MMGEWAKYLFRGATEKGKAGAVSVTSRGVTVVAARDRRKRPARKNRAAPLAIVQCILRVTH